MKLRTIMNWFEELSPLHYAEEWDNVGLLFGDEEQEIHHIMVSLDASDYVVEQAVAQKVDLLLTHHPMIFYGIKQMNNQSLVGRRIWKLATHQIACYAMHTNFDIKGGMGELAGNRIHLLNAVPLEITTSEGEEAEGIGRIGNLGRPMTVSAVAELVKEKFGLKKVILYGDAEKKVSRVAISPGSGKSEISHALEAGAELLITGDIGHHEGIDAVDQGLIIIDATHYGLEHIFIEFMAEYIRTCASEKEDIQITCMDAGSPIQIL